MTVVAPLRPRRPDDRAIGARIGRYVVRGVLGSGASSVVYDAEHRATGRRVALKALHAALASSETICLRFRREMRVLGALRAPNLVSAIDAGALEDGSPFLVLERLEGPSLASLLERGPIGLAPAIEVVRGVLEALVVLHGEGIVHRDLKPENIVIHRSAAGPVVKLLDLGVCAFIEDLDGLRHAGRPGKLTHDGDWVGTPCYMSPEQIDGRRVDARTDVYGAAVVLYECLVGHTPFEADTTLDVVTAVQRRPVLPLSAARPNCPWEVDALVLRALARDAATRPQCAADFSRALGAIALKLQLPTGLAALALLPSATAAVEAPPTRADVTSTVGSPRRAGPRGWTRDPWRLPTRYAPWIGAFALAVTIVAAVAGLTVHGRHPAVRLTPARATVAVSSTRVAPSAVPAERPPPEPVLGLVPQARLESLAPVTPRPLLVESRRSAARPHAPPRAPRTMETFIAENPFPSPVARTAVPARSGVPENPFLAPTP
jgi:serine/threonine-protein kinase